MLETILVSLLYANYHTITTDHMFININKTRADID